MNKHDEKRANKFILRLLYNKRANVINHLGVSHTAIALASKSQQVKAKF